jgi:hypothetical protein
VFIKSRVLILALVLNVISLKFNYFIFRIEFVLVLLFHLKWDSQQPHFITGRYKYEGLIKYVIE